MFDHQDHALPTDGIAPSAPAGPAPHGDATAYEAHQARLVQIENEVRELSAHIAAAQARLLDLVAEFDRTEAWGAWGYKTSAQWLSVVSGASPQLARREVALARKLDELPALKEAFGSGELSLDKADAVASIATPATEADLVFVARQAIAGDLGRVASSYRAARAAESSNEAERRRRRYVDFSSTASGDVAMRALLAPADADIVHSAIEASYRALCDELAPEAGPGDAYGRDAELHEPSRVDALVALAEASLACSPRARDESFLTVLHVDAATLAGSAADQPSEAGLCELANHRTICAETARRASCDGSLVSLIENGNQIVSVGRKTRVLPRHIRRALDARDRNCRFPGCRRTRYVHAHHIVHWAQGGETKLANLAKLCWHHHYLVHHGEITLEIEDSANLVFRRRDGAVISAGGKPAHGPDLAARNDAAGLAIDADTAPRWRGDYIDPECMSHVFTYDDPSPPDEPLRPPEGLV